MNDPMWKVREKEFSILVTDVIIHWNKNPDEPSWSIRAGG